MDFSLPAPDYGHTVLGAQTLIFARNYRRPYAPALGDREAMGIVKVAVLTVAALSLHLRGGTRGSVEIHSAKCSLGGGSFTRHRSSCGVNDVIPKLCSPLAAVFGLPRFA